MEIDESKFGKRKYHRGHRVEGVWVVGGVEKTLERRIFLVVVQDRTQETLLQIIKENVAEGSIIHTDYWAGYLGIDRLFGFRFHHERVNHTDCFVREDGCHTNTIEGKSRGQFTKSVLNEIIIGTWAGIKVNMSAADRTKKAVQFHLALFIWRRLFAKDLWGRLLYCLSRFGWIDGEVTEAAPEEDIISPEEGLNIDLAAPLSQVADWGTDSRRVDMNEYMFERSDRRYQLRQRPRQRYDPPAPLPGDQESSESSENSDDEYQP